jgi:hypothetical protein
VQSTAVSGFAVTKDRPNASWMTSAMRGDGGWIPAVDSLARPPCWLGSNWGMNAYSSFAETL